MANTVSEGKMRKPSAVAVVAVAFLLLLASRLFADTGSRPMVNSAIGSAVVIHNNEHPSVTVIEAFQPNASLIVTLYNETPRARKRFFQSLATWEKYLTFAKDQRYAVVVFYIPGLPQSLSPSQQAALRTIAPSLRLEFYPVTHIVPDRFKANIRQILEAQHPKRGLGYIFCSQFLGMEMYQHPRIQSAQYILRLDDDITFDAPTPIDLFETMHREGLAVGWNCIMHQWNKSSAFMDERVQKFVEQYTGQGHVVQPAYFENNPKGRWNMRLFAGCVELYRADLFVSPAYQTFLTQIDAMEGIYRFSWMEQAFKTLWMEIQIPPQQWRRFACELPTLHRGIREQWFDYEGCVK